MGEGYNAYIIKPNSGKHVALIQYEDRLINLKPEDKLKDAMMAVHRHLTNQESEQSPTYPTLTLLQRAKVRSSILLERMRQTGPKL